MRKKAVMVLHRFHQLADPRREGPLAGVDIDRNFRTMCDKVRAGVGGAGRVCDKVGEGRVPGAELGGEGPTPGSSQSGVHGQPWGGEGRAGTRLPPPLTTPRLPIQP